VSLEEDRSMAHECGCHCDSRVDPGHTVGDLVRRNPEALQILQAMGINHCCGAHLTLAEAAASAGVPLDALLGALAGTGKAPA
jgi:iron-sulfur cluster repair protein YtfE (RIC family)